MTCEKLHEIWFSETYVKLPLAAIYCAGNTNS